MISKDGLAIAAARIAAISAALKLDKKIATEDYLEVGNSENA